MSLPTGIPFLRPPGKPIRFGTGWRADPEAVRKSSMKVSSGDVQDILRKFGTYASLPPALGANKKTHAGGAGPPADLEPQCTPVENQGVTNACSAAATVGLFEYFLRKYFLKDYTDLSIRFLYKVAREEEGVVGDEGVFLSTAMRCVRTTGVAPDKVWSFDPLKLDEVPPPKVRSLAKAYSSHLQYIIDEDGADPALILAEIQRHLRCGWPCTIGFPLYNSVKDEVLAGEGPGGARGHVRLPVQGDAADEGHSVLIVGYDDTKDVGGAIGAFKFRNSWGDGWGERGYGWLPYQYLLDGVAKDVWSITDRGFLQSAM